jgi:hypothetical protein
VKRRLRAVPEMKKENYFPGKSEMAWSWDENFHEFSGGM